MPTYVALSNWTQKGMESIKEGPHRLHESKKVFEKAGAKITAFYVLLGGPDVVMVFEAADDSAAAAVSLAVAAGGTIRGNVYRAFDEKDYAKVVASIP